jgi:peptide/nickel transport system substrate-binding protein
MFKKSLVLLLAFVMLVSFALTGCTQSEPAPAEEPTPAEEPATKEMSEEDKYGGSVNYAIWSTPKGVFNPSVYDDEYDAQVIEMVYEGMLELQPDLTFRTKLAESYEVSEDNLSVTFKLKDGVKWHDGTPFTAEDVEFTLTSICHPDYTGPRYNEINAIAGAEAYHNGEADTVTGIEVIDPLTIKISTNEVFAPFNTLIGARMIIPKHIWGEIPVAEWKEVTDVLRNPVGTGPFKVNEFAPDQYVDLVANEDYHGGRPYLDNIILMQANQETAIAQLINGELTVMTVSNMNKDDISLMEESGITVQEVVSRGYQYMGINNRLPIFEKKEVRQALAYAINRQGMVDNIMEGYGVVANAPYASFMWALPKEGLNDYAYNPEKAKEILASVEGFEYKEDVLYFQGEPVKLTLKYPTGNKVREKSAPIIQQNLADIGIELELSIMEFSTLLDQVMDNHDFEFYLMGWGLDSDPDGKSMWHSSLTGKGGWNMGGFANEESDRLLDEGVKYLTVEERQPIYHEWATLMNDEMPSVFLYSMYEGRAYRPELKGTNFYPFSNLFDVNKWYLEK